jgi:hypothetical protein
MSKVNDNNIVDFVVLVVGGWLLQKMYWLGLILLAFRKEIKTQASSFVVR